MNHRYADCQNSDPDDNDDCACMGTRSDLVRELHAAEEEIARLRDALERVMVETGTSSLAHHAARDALAPKPKEREATHHHLVGKDGNVTVASLAEPKEPSE